MKIGKIQVKNEEAFRTIEMLRNNDTNNHKNNDNNNNNNNYYYYYYYYYKMENYNNLTGEKDVAPT